MAYIEFNPNPVGRRVGDCSVRAVSKALNMGWEAAYVALVIAGLNLADMPSSDSVWGSVLRNHGFRRMPLPNDCPVCFTVKDFCEQYTDGVFVLGTGGHVVTSVSGDYFDAWDSGSEVIQFVWYKEGE